MKLLSKNKIIVSALALCIGASLAGSVSGTIAWYQYSTRANVSFIGQSGGISGNLQMRFAGDTNWTTRITYDQLNEKLAAGGYATKVAPITFGAMGRNAELPADSYVQPIPGVANMASWIKAAKKNYAQFTLELRYNERDGVVEGEGNAAKDAKNIEKDVYLSNLVLKKDGNVSNSEKGDLSNALRVHISSSYKNMTGRDGQGVAVYADPAVTNNELISKNGGVTLTEGELDVDGDGVSDKGYQDDEFGFGYKYDSNGSAILDNSSNHVHNEYQTIIYGSGSQVSYAANATGTAGAHWTQDEIDAATEGQPAYGKTTADWKTEPVYPALAGLDANNRLTDLTFDDDNDGGDANTGTAPVSRRIGRLMESETEFLTVTVTLWVEGWQQLDGANGGQSAVWDTKYIDSSFNIGIQFAVEDAAF